MKPEAWTLKRPNKADLEFETAEDAIRWLARFRLVAKDAKLFNPDGKLTLTMGNPQPDA